MRDHAVTSYSDYRLSTTIPRVRRASYEPCQRGAKGKTAGEREKPKEPKRTQGQSSGGGKGALTNQDVAVTLQITQLLACVVTWTDIFPDSQPVPS